jgi:hypothetical protein
MSFNASQFSESIESFCQESQNKYNEILDEMCLKLIHIFPMDKLVLHSHQGQLWDDLVLTLRDGSTAVLCTVKQELSGNQVKIIGTYNTDNIAKYCLHWMEEVNDKETV